MPTIHPPEGIHAEPERSECRSCMAEIIWCVTEKGKRMPIDAVPNPLGRFVKVRIDQDGNKLVHYLRGDELATNQSKTYTSHFSTCENRGNLG